MHMGICSLVSEIMGAKILLSASILEKIKSCVFSYEIYFIENQYCMKHMLLQKKFVIVNHIKSCNLINYIIEV
jgi:hypothetical protein